MDATLFFTIVGSAFAVIGCVYQFLRNFKTDINSHIDRLDSNSEKVTGRLDALNNRLDGHATRIDQLYKMFVDNNESFNKKWADMLERIDRKSG